MNTTGKKLGTWDVFVAGVALVVAASTLVSDLNGYFNLGGAFIIALFLGFFVNLLLAISASDLSARFPKSGAIYNYAKASFSGNTGQFIGTFLGLSFFGMFAFTAAGETAAGALGLRALLGTDWDVNYFVAFLMIASAIPSIFGTQAAAWVSAGLLIFMLGIRWFFGLAGFFGWGHDYDWAFSNLMDGVDLGNFNGSNGILTVGLALAFWSFVGVEFACSLAEEVEDPARSMPKGMIIGLLGILLTSLVLGVGVTGILPLSEWQSLVQGELGQQGQAPQLAAGQVLFGETGYTLMALASVSATMGTLTIAFATMPKIIFHIAKDGHMLGPVSRVFNRLNPNTGTPINAVLFTLLVFLLVALSSNAVLDWILSASYVWILIYVAFHILALINCNRPAVYQAFKPGFTRVAASLGIVLTLVALYYAFIGQHVYYGTKALLVIGVAFFVAMASMLFESGKHTDSTERQYS